MIFATVLDLVTKQLSLPQRSQICATVFLIIAAAWIYNSNAGHGLSTFLFDSYQRIFPRQAQTQPVVIVDIDEASLVRFGQWPWPRNRLAELIKKINAMQPLAIGVDIYMPESDASSPEALAANLPPQANVLGQALRQLPANDTLLADAISQAPIVLAVAGFTTPTLSVSRSFLSTPIHIKNGQPADVLPNLAHYPFVLASLPQLQKAARGQALVTAPLEEGIVRRIPLASAVNEQAVAALSLEMLRIATESSAIEMNFDQHGITALEVADLRVPVQANGDIWLHFAHPDASRYISAVDILDGRVPAERFSGKLALIGLTGLGLNDVRTTPLRDNVAGVEIQAQLIETFFDGRFLLRPWWMSGLEIASLLLCGASLIWLTPIRRVRVSAALLTTFIGLAFCTGIWLFLRTGLLIDMATVSTALLTLYALLLGGVYLDNARQRRWAEMALQTEREAAAKVAGELNAARRIQMGSLPQANNAFPGEQRFQLAASLEPARSVGGDLYDFFMLDNRHLFFVIGDVSGKGVPASLFMAVTKALAKSAALRAAISTTETWDLSAMISAANRDMSRENPEMLFVTLIAGILNADTGEVLLVNAGHDAPWRLGQQAPLQIETTGGPPLCVMDDFPYPVDRLQLAVGDSLCLSTDGVNEAMNSQGELYGNTRLAEILAKIAGREKEAESIANAVRADVSQFVGAAEASDDLTLLVVRWLGATDRK